jgi:hypothetical protein
MGVYWAAGLMRWRPHESRRGEIYALSHLHPFRFTVTYEAYKGMPPRTVAIHVGFSMHVFTCRLDSAVDDPEIYRDEREERAFDHERYLLSRNLRSIITGLEKRRCFYAKNKNFVTVELDGMPGNREYRVFFSVRKKDGSAVELVVQSAYPADAGQRTEGLLRKPVGFRVIVMETLRCREPQRLR